MSTKIFITLPVADLPRALGFYEALGYNEVLRSAMLVRPL